MTEIERMIEWQRTAVEMIRAGHPEQRWLQQWHDDSLAEECILRLEKTNET